MTNPDIKSARRRAILAILLAALLFAGAAACVKALGGEVPLAQIILFRSAFALPVLLPLLRAAGGWRALRTTRPGGHALRLAFGFAGMVGAFYGYAHLPLATVTALGFTMPLFLALLAVPLLGEKLEAARGLAALVGFGGVLLMVRPGAGGDGWTMLVVLGAALAWALAMITIRRMGAQGESGVAIVLWFSFGSTLVALAWSVPGWVWPTPTQWLLLAVIGGVSAFAQILMTEAYRVAEPTVVAPFEYSGIVWTTALGALIWAEAPDGWDALGILLLVGAGLALWRREAMAAGLKR
ncbi:DMT family transporter [Sabulicella glaciei]|uniref:DMT family transporter n=1 Tax=Sabulicella glaciei TaxID=2984948 RepID=A0ABT3NWF3_9PROT|nr:DMT family transporter [Roseococcus sp. MDT2-1-1]MCW8086461.1 DMT family transporter [Roseococcus sp. MDT2-1-1]